MLDLQLQAGCITSLKERALWEKALQASEPRERVFPSGISSKGE